MERLIKNIPNILTLIRVVLTVLLIYYITHYYGKYCIAFMIFLAIFLTDFLDGKIARLCGITSCFGAVFDVCADMFYILSSYILLCYLKIMPLWFLVIIISKFIEFTITSHLIKKMVIGSSVFVFDFVGKLVAVLFYLVPLVTYVSFHFSKFIYLFTVNLLLYIITLLTIVSFSHRILNCVKLYKISRFNYENRV